MNPVPSDRLLIGIANRRCPGLAVVLQESIEAPTHGGQPSIRKLEDGDVAGKCRRYTGESACVRNGDELDDDEQRVLRVPVKSELLA